MQGPFCAVMDEYSHLQHSELVPPKDLHKPSGQTYNLPSHGVSEQYSTTTKLRAVFDASVATTSGASINDTLPPGPSLLTTILICFRTHPIAICGDVSKMFREILLADTERNFHHYIWWEEQQQPQDWRMCCLTFGVASSPFLAVRVLQQMAADHNEQFTKAAHTISTCFYVDDLLTGADSPGEAAQLRRDQCEHLSHGGMTLRKWRTNRTDVLETFPEELWEKDLRSHSR